MTGDADSARRARGLAAYASQFGIAEMRGHVRWAVEHGVTAEQIEELATLLTIYAGFPRATTAMELIRAELAAIEERA